MNNFKDQLKNIISEKPSTWKEKVEFRMNNPWLREYSSQIARRILTAIEDDEELNQSKLANLLNVSSQQVSKIVHGRENLTLETIYKISKALNVELITFPDYKYSASAKLSESVNEFKHSAAPKSYAIDFKEQPLYFREMQVIKGGRQSYDKEGVAMAS